MKALIIEDELHAAEQLREMILEIDPEIEIVEPNLDSIEKSVKWLRKNKADLILLDIHLSDGLSFNIFDQIKVDTPIIFTTAYDQYAIKAFKLNSIDYLLKPINKNELRDALEKYRNLTHNYSSSNLEKLISAIKQPQKAEPRHRFLVQVGNKIKKVDDNEIAAFYALNKYNFLVTEEGQSYAIDHTLDKIEEMTDPDKFFRINRQLIVSIDSIDKMEAYSRGRIFLSLKVKLPTELDTIVSISRSPDFKNWLGG